jgi:proline iminopeptidase
MSSSVNGYVTSNGIRLYYEVEGQGEPLILLNGGPGFSHDYLQEMRSLSRYARLVFFDQRGTGKSDKADPSTYRIDANVEDVENLRRSLSLGRCIVLGHSWGGMLAQAYVLKYPQGVSKLILADTVSSIEDLNSALARMRAVVPESVRAIYERCEREGLYKGRETYPPEYQKALEVAYEPVLIGTPPPDYLTDMFAKVAYDVYRTMWGEESEFKVTGTLAEFNVEPRLREIRAPTLVIVGGNDIMTVPMAQKTARLIRGSKVEIFEHSRHFPFIEEKERFIEVVRSFILQS